MMKINNTNSDFQNNQNNMSSLRIAGIFGFIFIFINLSVQGQIMKISGNVRDANTLYPLGNVNLILLQTTVGSMSGENGDFNISVSKPGTYVVQASMTGYKSERKRVNVLSGRNNEINFLLQPVTIQIDSVVITAEREFRNLMSRPYTEPISLIPAISKIKFDNIRKQGAITVIDAMNHVPGGLTESRGRQVKQFFSVRGQKYPYPGYALNGVWQKEFEELPYFLSASDIEEIEIVRSSAALLTGLSGMSGLINIRTREYSSPETRVDLEYGPFGSFHTHVSTGNKIGQFGYAAGAGYDRSNGPSGKHANEDMANIYTQLNWKPSGKIDLKANLFYLDGKRQMMKAEAPADIRYQNMLQGFDPYRAILSNIKMVYRPNEKLSSELQLFYSHRNPTFYDEVRETESNEKDSEWGVNLMQSISLTESNILRFGGLYSRWVAPNGKRFYTGRRCDTETFSGVIVDEQRIGNFTVDAGIRITGTWLNDYGAFNIEGEGSQFRTVTGIQDIWEPAYFQGNMGAAYQVSDRFSVYFSSAAGQIEPRRGTLDISFNEPSAETRYKFDLGVVHKFGNSGKLTLTTFGVVQRNAIALSGTLFNDTVVGVVRELYVNRDQRQLGFEAEIISPRLFDLFEPYFNLAFMRSKMDEGGSMVVNKEHPSVIAGGGFYASKKHFDINVLCKYISDFENQRFAPVTAGPQPLGDYFTIDMTSGYTLKDMVRFYIRVRNLSDIKYSTVVGYPDFGRMLFGGIQLKLTKRNRVR